MPERGPRNLPGASAFLPVSECYAKGMFEPYPDLVETHTLTLPTGEGITFDQTLWGKVIAIQTLHVDGGRYHLEETMITARLRQLLEGLTVGGVWAFPAEDPRFAEVAREVRDVIETLFGVS